MQHLWNGGCRNIEGVICQLVIPRKVWGCVRVVGGGDNKTLASTSSCRPESIDNGPSEPSLRGSYHIYDKSWALSREAMCIMPRVGKIDLSLILPGGFHYHFHQVRAAFMIIYGNYFIILCRNIIWISLAISLPAGWDIILLSLFFGRDIISNIITCWMGYHSAFIIFWQGYH